MSQPHVLYQAGGKHQYAFRLLPFQDNLVHRTSCKLSVSSLAYRYHSCAEHAGPENGIAYRSAVQDTTSSALQLVAFYHGHFVNL